MSGILSVPKVILINPPSPDSFVYIRDTNRSGRRSAERTIWPQTSLAMIAGVLDRSVVKIVDCIACNISYKQLYEIMQDFKPDWLIFNPITCTFVHDCIVAHYAKSLGAKTIVISPHAKATEREVYERFKTIDHVVSYERGGSEVEYIVRELIEHRPRAGTSFSDLPPARHDLLPSGRYSLPFIGNFTFVVVSRGCPYKCIYCRQGVSYEGQVRHRRVDVVIDEIRRYGLKNIALHSDTATLNKEWMYEFCAKLPKDVRWICNSRVDTVDDELLKTMRNAGCWMVCFGIESGDDTVLKLNKKGATCEQAKKAVYSAKKAGLKVWGYFMLGLFGDNYETMQRTIRFALKIPVDIANFAISAPYPGTEWEQLADRCGWLVDRRYELRDQNYSAVVDQPDCPGWLVREMQKRAYLRWFLSLRGLRFGLMALPYWRTFIRVIADHIRSNFKKDSKSDFQMACKEVVR